IAGWLAGKLMNSHFSMLGNIAIGIVGGIVGNVVLSVFGISGEGFIGRIIVGAVGACILIALGRAFSK
ncbi:MAG TPA: GlsB/YeaQ/YmgE family stress response membrane protein, partial [Lachnospiraceae bacterium]|nr:GlsB/YeaQ/YmgE family stress response membrane protein [Lachnospiraceae bacterium]